MKIPFVFPFVLAILLLQTCQNPSGGPDVVGIWQGENNQGKAVRIEFSPDGHYRLSVDGKQLIEDDRHTNCLKYRVTDDGDAFQIDLFGVAAGEALCRLKATFPVHDRLELQLLTLSDPAEPCDDIRLKRL